MKRHLLTFLTLSLCVGVANAQPPAKPPGLVPPPAPDQTNAPKTDFSKIFKSDKEKIAYGIGMSQALGLKGRLKSLEIDYDADAMVKGFKDNLGEGASVITEAQMKEILNDLNNELRAKQEAKRKQAAEENKIKGEKNKVEGAAFLEKNKKEQGVITLPDGLQYKVITEGSGDSPKAEDEVTVNYKGTLIDGTEFDSSYKRNQPFTTRVQGGIIQGWTEALKLMKPGAKWQLFIPSALAYGERPMGPIIGPDSTLIFEIELISVKPGTPAAAPPGAALHSGGPGAPLTSDIIKVPSAEGLKRGEKIETIKPEDVDKERAKANTVTNK